MSDLDAAFSAMTDAARHMPTHALLMRLRSPGAFLTTTGAPIGTIKLVEPMRRSALAAVLLPDVMIDRILSAGWLIKEESHGHYQVRLSPQAIAQLNKLKTSRSQRGKPIERLRLKREKASQTTFPRKPAMSPLDAFAKRLDRDGRPIISSAQREAGERLAADFQRGQMMPRVTADWSEPTHSAGTRRTTPGAGVEMSDAVAAARQRVSLAIDAVGSELSGVVIDVCCFETGLVQTERRHALPQRSAKIILQLGLTRLARHYGIIAQAPRADTKIRHSGAKDFRPTLDQRREP
jgi:Domain of unknown function (DUF6456)